MPRGIEINLVGVDAPARFPVHVLLCCFPLPMRVWRFSWAHVFCFHVSWMTTMAVKCWWLIFQQQHAGTTWKAQLSLSVVQ